MKKLLLLKCPKCRSENYGPAIEENICVWCEYEATENDIDDVNVFDYKKYINENK